MTSSKVWPASMYDTKTWVIGMPYNYGQPKLGVSEGPSRMRKYGVLNEITNMGYELNDTGDIEFTDVENDVPYFTMKRPRAVGKANKLIQAKVAECLKKGACLNLGGDHSLAIGSLIGHAAVHPDFGVIWVDAHADINPPQASGSGNVHGMPLAFLVHELADYIPNDIPEFDWIKPCLHAKNLAYIGLRDLDPAEKAIIEQFGIAAYTMNDVMELGITEVVNRAIAAVSQGNSKRSIHLSFDIDGLDPTVAPSTGTPVPGGLMLREGTHVVEKVAATGRLDVMDLVEVNPTLGSEADQEKTLLAAQEVVAAWYGRRNRMQLAPGYVIPPKFK